MSNINHLRKFGIISCIAITILFSVLLLINIVGLFINPYNVDKYQHRPNDTTISYEMSLKNIELLHKRYKVNSRSINNQDDLIIFKNIVNTVFERMSNLMSPEKCGKNLYEISIFDNWILWIKSNFIKPDYRHEFADPYRALKTGAGFCSQQGLAVVALLEEFGYKAGLVGLKGHVVAWVETKRGMYILDPDYGVIMPFDFEYACSHRNDLLEYYKNMDLQLKNKIAEANRVADIYCRNQGKNFAYKPGVDGYKGNGYTDWEDLLYRMKWVLPLMAIMIAFLCIAAIKNDRSL